MSPNAAHLQWNKHTRASPHSKKTKTKTKSKIMREAKSSDTTIFSATSPSIRVTSPAAVGFAAPLLLPPSAAFHYWVAGRDSVFSRAPLLLVPLLWPRRPPLSRRPQHLGQLPRMSFCSLTTSSHAATFCPSFLMYHCCHQHSFSSRSDRAQVHMKKIKSQNNKKLNFWQKTVPKEKALEENWTLDLHITSVMLYH